MECLDHGLAVVVVVAVVVGVIVVVLCTCRDIAFIMVQIF